MQSRPSAHGHLFGVGTNPSKHQNELATLSHPDNQEMIAISYLVQKKIVHIILDNFWIEYYQEN